MSSEHVISLRLKMIYQLISLKETESPGNTDRCEDRGSSRIHFCVETIVKDSKILKKKKTLFRF